MTNYIIGTYVETFTVTTIIGAAGSLMIILLWIFILNQIMLYGAEVSKIYATTSPTHSREHLPPTAEKIVKSLEIAGEKIEQATKGNVLEPTEKAVEKPQAEEAAEKTEIQTPKKEEKTEEKTIETKDSTMKQNAEAVEPEKPNEGSVEVTVKIKTPNKKEKSQD